jgi:hypothetical protein
MPGVKRFLALASVMLLACGDVVTNNPDADGGSDDIDADGTDGTPDSEGTDAIPDGAPAGSRSACSTAWATVRPIGTPT